MFKSGNNKGPMSWIGNAPRVVDHHHEVEVNQTVEGWGVAYWYTYAQKMKEGVQERNETIDAFQKIAIERRANNAGLRAVIRYLADELGKASPNHPLLDKKNRNRIFDEFHMREMVIALEANNLQIWEPLKRPDEKQSP